MQFIIGYKLHKFIFGSVYDLQIIQFPYGFQSVIIQKSQSITLFYKLYSILDLLQLVHIFIGPDPFFGQIQLKQSLIILPAHLHDWQPIIQAVRLIHYLQGCNKLSHIMHKCRHYQLFSLTVSDMLKISSFFFLTHEIFSKLITIPGYIVGMICVIWCPLVNSSCKR